MANQIHIVPHFHWDREWYFTAEESKILLVNDMEEILERLETDSEYPCFVMDGQTAVLEDYLSVKPENRERLKKLIESGKLIIGPWYTQTDELVVGGESIVRNLLYGKLDCEAFGPRMMIGYLPDSFGQSARLPQILNGFGIDRCMFWRGTSERMGSSKTEFYWEGDDNARVTVQLLPLGYAIGKYLPTEPEALKKRLDKYFPVLDRGATTDYILLPNGHDQMPLQKNIREVMEQIEACYPGRKTRLGRYEEVFEKVEERGHLDTLRGEFLDGKYMRVHRSIYSSRADLKSANTRIENKITNQLEPLASIAYHLGFDYHHGLIEAIWKELMKNHAHDSIGCCCSDKVHQAISDRFFLAEERADQLITFYQRKLVDAMSTEEALDKLAVFNTLPYERDGVVIGEVITKWKHFSLTDETGASPAFEVLHSEIIDAGLIDRQIVHYGDYDPFVKYTVAVRDTFPAMGYKAYLIRETEAWPQTAEGEVSSENCLENEFYRIEVASVKQDAPRGLAVLTDSVREYELVGENFNTIALTLFRCVGVLGKENMYRRPGRPSGIKMETPDSQMQGRQTYTFALTSDMTHAARRAKEFTTPLTTYNKMPYNAMKLNTPTIQTPYSYSLLSLSDPDVTVTTLKKAEKGEELLLRCCNENKAAIQAQLNGNISILGETTLDEMLVEESGMNANLASGNISLLPNQIRTILLKKINHKSHKTRRTAMKMIFASDSFKGSLSSQQILALLEQAAEQVFPNVKTSGVLMADGGEGTVDALVSQLGGTYETAVIHDPCFRLDEASYGILPEGSAVIEMAAASGLPMVPADKRNPMETTSYGTGELIAHALSQGIRKIAIAIGGSATNDGGMGMLAALGVKFLDESGNLLRGCGGDLEKVASIDLSGLHPAIEETEFTVMCDVTNPLLGPEGATFTFSAQKGADAAMQQRLEAGMAHYAELAEKAVGVQAKEVPGAGAAGGLGFALMSFLGAKLQSGIETVLDLVHFDELLKDADLVVTGEGRMDWQSSYGKVPSGVGKRCQKAGVPAVAIVGGLLPGYESIYETGIETVITTVSGIMPLEQAIRDSESLYLDAARRLFRSIRCGINIRE